jgi:ribonuclease J
MKNPRKSAAKGQGRDTSELVFCALGGIGEIGMNCYLYGTGPASSREWLMVDLGITFPEGDFEPGVDVILPDTRFIEDEQVKLAGIVLTHAHEDHIGAVIELWPRLKAPVYATPFAAALLKAKLAEFPSRTKLPIRIIQPGAQFEIGAFSLEFIDVAHSIPEPQALLIRTADGKVLHTGDWKIDPTPFNGSKIDEARLSALGDGSVDAIVCDSTNAMRPGQSPSESEVAATIKEVVLSAPRAVAVTVFSSNVARILAVAQAAQAAGRLLVIAGRALHRMIEVAIETGHLPASLRYHDQEHYSNLAPEKAVVLCTGSQGEPRAALARIADAQHPHVRLAPGDLVIFSSRTIPGNDKAVGRIQNKLVDIGCRLLTDADALVHVTGHPRQAELSAMYDWVKPRCALPVHGEARHLAAHAELARRAGVPKVMVVRNGDIVKLCPGEAAVIDEAPVGRLFRDGNLLVGSEEAPVRERRKLANVGMVVVVLVLNPRGQLVAEPEVLLDGVPETDAEGTDMLDVALDAIDGTLRSIPEKRRRDHEMIEEAVRKSVRSAIEQAWGKRPIVKVVVPSVEARG